MTAETLIQANVPRLRRNKWETETLTYGYSNGTLWVDAERCRVGDFPTLDDALNFLRRAMRATITDTITTESDK